MTIQTLNNNVTLLEQRTKINANFSELAATISGIAGQVAQHELTGIAYDVDGRMTAYTSDGVAHTITYPTATTAVITNTAGATRNVTFDSAGRVAALI